MYDPNKPYTIPQQIEMLKQMFNNQYYSVNISVTTLTAANVAAKVNALTSVKLPRTIYGIALNINVTSAFIPYTYTVYYNRACIGQSAVILFKTNGYPSDMSGNVNISVNDDGSISAATV